MMTLVFFFTGIQEVQECVPEANFRDDLLLGQIDSLQNELTAYKERELMLLKHIGHEEYVVTAYLPTDFLEGWHSGLTVTGALAKPYFTLAVDPARVPMNSWIWIDGRGWWKAQDTGNAIRGKMLDLCLSSREEAYEFGVRKMKIKILK